MNNESREIRIAQFKKLANLLDTKFEIPGIPFKFGVDSIVGLIPVAGDFIGAGFSGYLILTAAKMGVRKRTLAKMTRNALIDLGLGSVPLLGDIFDFAYKANTANLNLLVEELEISGKEPRDLEAVTSLAITTVVLLVVGTVILSCAAIIGLVYALS